jgi:hypothetical protein
MTRGMYRLAGQTALASQPTDVSRKRAQWPTLHVWVRLTVRFAALL